MTLIYDIIYLGTKPGQREWYVVYAGDMVAGPYASRDQARAAYPNAY